ncbi:MAG: SDR family NAD(P)-dependent oxidoreductase [Planctomycetia bacterium]|nr:SDR family NAD(P)-dependent oxidoreductase [Planctomycetia bacterium]
MHNYAGQVVLITGAAGAIGSQLAEQFAKRGASLGLMDLAIEPLQQIRDKLVQQYQQVKVSLFACDITSRQTMHAAIKQLETELGPTNVIIANAGVALNNPIKNFSADIFEKQIAVNLIGMANTLEPILPGLIERKQGHIVALSSLASYRGLPHMAGYCASKAGVSAFLDSLRVELKPYGIHCTTICPSYIRSQMNAMLGVPTPGILSPEDAVNRMMPAIEKKKPYFAFPFGNYALLVMSRLMPTWMGDYLTRLNVKVEY